jgi:hypothetical protein
VTIESKLQSFYRTFHRPTIIAEPLKGGAPAFHFLPFWKNHLSPLYTNSNKKMDPRRNSFDPQGALREVSTRELTQFLPRRYATILIGSVYFEPATVLALEQFLRRHTTTIRGDQPRRSVIEFDTCHDAGACFFELALCEVLNKRRNFRNVTISSQRLNFTPALVDALSNCHLRCLTIRNDHLDESNMKRLALCLCQNPHIRSLSLCGAFQGDASIVTFASCIHGMTGLCRIELQGNGFGTLGEQALFKVLEETSVDQLVLEGKPDYIQAHIDFLTRLKQKGGRWYIGALTSNNTIKPNQWIELFDEFKDDTNALYYILRESPGPIFTY